MFDEGAAFEGFGVGFVMDPGGGAGKEGLGVGDIAAGGVEAGEVADEEDAHYFGCGVGSSAGRGRSVLGAAQDGEFDDVGHEDAGDDGGREV